MPFLRVPDADAAFARLSQLVKANPDLCDGGWIANHSCRPNPHSEHLYRALQVIPFVLEKGRKANRSYALKHHVSDALATLGCSHDYLSNGEFILCMLALGYPHRRCRVSPDSIFCVTMRSCVPLPPLRGLPASERLYSKSEFAKDVGLAGEALDLSWNSFWGYHRVGASGICDLGLTHADCAWDAIHEVSGFSLIQECKTEGHDSPPAPHDAILFRQRIVGE